MSDGIRLGPTPTEVEIANDLQAAITTLRRSDDFSNYESYWERLRQRLTQHRLEKASSAVEPEYINLIEARNVAEIRETLLQRIGISGLLGGVVFAAGASVWALAQTVIPALAGIPLLLVAAAIVGVAGLATVVLRIIRRVRETRAIRDEVSWASYKYREKLDQTARELLLASINRILGPEGRLPFPASGRWLVESHNRPAVPLRTLSYVRRFIAEHESSAIGIAGPRGIGKSTVMREILRTADPDFFRVLVSAPVAYDGYDFLKRLAKRLAFAVSGGERRALSRRSNYFRSPVAPLWILLMVAGIVAVTSGVLGALEAPSFLFPTIAGATLVLIGYLATAIGWLGARRRVWNDSRVRNASDLVRWLDYDVTDEKSATAEVSALKFVTANVGATQTTRRRDASHESLAMAIGSFLESATERGNRRFLIFVDELDKIAKADDAVDIINLLKDLFHTPGVHFVVSVSMEALANFELRGVQVRDAFDSSFDMIVEVEPMTGQEALAVLESRVAGFPPLAGAAIHAWSGGLPRELLRLARQMIETNRDSELPLPILEVFREVVVEDLVSKVTALSRSTDFDGDLTGVLAALDRFRSLTSMSGEELQAALGRPFLETALGRRLELAAAWLDFLHRSAPKSKTAWTSVSGEVLEAADAVAKAVAASSFKGGLANEAHQHAVSTCRVET